MKKRSSNKEVNRCSHLIVGLASRWTVEEKTTNFLINGKEPSGHTRHAICVLYSVRAGGSGDEGKVARRKETNSWKIDFSGEKPATPLLDTINYPIHMKNLSTRSIKRWSVTLKTRKHQLSMRLKELLGCQRKLNCHFFFISSLENTIFKMISAAAKTIGIRSGCVLCLRVVVIGYFTFWGIFINQACRMCLSVLTVGFSALF
ncbi:hypothetical protein AAC387_Pa09g0122 [Persea americana]